MKIDNPDQGNFSTPQGTLRWARSVFKALFGGLALAAPVSQDSSGTWNTFTIDNGGGAMLRIGATGDASNTLMWDSTGACTVPHGLQRQPIGFIVCDSNGQAIIWRTSTATQATIALKTSSPTFAATIWVF